MAGPEQHPHAIPNAALDAFDHGSREYVLGNNDKALEHLERAVSLHDDFSDAFYMRGLALLRAGRQQDGIDSLQKAADLTQNTILRDYALNRIAKEQGDDRARFRKRLEDMPATRASEGHGDRGTGQDVTSTVEPEPTDEGGVAPPTESAEQMKSDPEVSDGDLEFGPGDEDDAP